MQTEENYAQLKIRVAQQTIFNKLLSKQLQRRQRKWIPINFKIKKNLSCYLFTVQKDAMTEVNAPGKDGGGWGGELSLHE